MELVIVLLISLCALVFYITMYSGATPEDEQKPAPKTAEELMSMTKVEIEEYAREYGIELDRRKTKKNMVADFQDRV